MGKSQENYQIVYRGCTLERYIPVGWVFFQRPKENGGGYWLGKTFDWVFALEFDKPVSLGQGITHIVMSTGSPPRKDDVDDFRLI